MLLVMLVRGLVINSELEVAVRKVERAIRPIMEMLMFAIVHRAEKNTLEGMREVGTLGLNSIELCLNFYLCGGGPRPTRPPIEVFCNAKHFVEKINILACCC